MRGGLCSGSSISLPRAPGIALDSPPPPSPITEKPFLGHLSARRLWTDSLSALSKPQHLQSPDRSAGLTPAPPPPCCHRHPHVLGGSCRAPPPTPPGISSASGTSVNPLPLAPVPLRAARRPPPCLLPHCRLSRTTLGSCAEVPFLLGDTRFPCRNAPPPTLKAQFEGLTLGRPPQPGRVPRAPRPTEAVTCLPDRRGVLSTQHPRPAGEPSALSPYSMRFRGTSMWVHVPDVTHHSGMSCVHRAIHNCGQGVTGSHPSPLL